MSENKTDVTKEQSKPLLSDQFMANLLSEEANKLATVASSESCNNTTLDSINNVDIRGPTEIVKSATDLVDIKHEVSDAECSKTSDTEKSQNHESSLEKYDTNCSMESKPAEESSEGLENQFPDPVVKPVVEIRGNVTDQVLKSEETAVNGESNKDISLPATVMEDDENKAKDADLQNYRCDPWSDDDTSSTFSLNSSSDCSDSFLDKMHRKSPVVNKVQTVKTRGELDIDELPPINDLHITLLEKEMKKVGTVYAIVDKLVIVRALKELQALDLDSVLFLSHEKPLGRIFDVFGPVVEPFYSVRFNSPEHIIERGVIVDEDVFFAPEKRDITMYVFVDLLREQKGSDASWKDNNEPPEEFLDYSDDEQERAAKMKRRAKNRTLNDKEDNEVQVVPHKIPNTRLKKDDPMPPVWLKQPNFNASPQQFSGMSQQRNAFGGPFYPGAAIMRSSPLPNPFNSGMQHKFTTPGSYSQGQNLSFPSRSPMPVSNHQQPFGQQNVSPQSFRLPQTTVCPPSLNFAPPHSILLMPQQNILPQSQMPYLQSSGHRNHMPPQSPSPLAFQPLSAMPHLVQAFVPQSSLYQQPIFGQMPVLGPVSPSLHPHQMAVSGPPLMAVSGQQNFGLNQCMPNSGWQTSPVPPNAPLSVHIPQSPSPSPTPYIPQQNNPFMAPHHNFQQNGYHR